MTTKICPEIKVGDYVSNRLDTPLGQVIRIVGIWATVASSRGAERFYIGGLKLTPSPLTENPTAHTPVDMAYTQASAAVVTAVPDGGGLRFDTDKLRLDLLPAEWELELGRVTTAGSKKYAPRNWERGMAWMKMIGCAKRHILKFLLGEHYDPETGAHHLALAAWNLLALMSYDMRKLGTDDRPPTVRVGHSFERLTGESDT